MLNVLIKICNELKLLALLTPITSFVLFTAFKDFMKSISVLFFLVLMCFLLEREVGQDISKDMSFL